MRLAHVFRPASVGGILYANLTFVPVHPSAKSGLEALEAAREWDSSCTCKSRQRLPKLKVKHLKHKTSTREWNTEPSPGS